MAKPKAQTLQQRFGFMDSDLTTSDHDTMMIWLGEHAEGIVKQIVDWNDTWDSQQVSEGRRRAQDIVAATVSYEEQEIVRLQKFKGNEWLESSGLPHEQTLKWLREWPGMPEPPAKPAIRLIVTLEYPVMSDKYMIGFVDMRAVYSPPALDVAYPWMSHHYQGGSILDTGPRQYPRWEVEYRDKSERIYFEVKTVIPSMGELMRQLQMYRAYLEGQFYVVSSDDKFVPQFLDQKIGFVRYPGGEVLKP